MSKFQSHLFILSFLFILISGCSSIFNHSDSLVIPINSINPQPILGVWKGKYSCAQGITGVTLVLDQNDKNKKIIDGTFVFYPTRLNPQVPNGSFTMRGALTPEKELILIPQKWIDHPFLYEMISMDGRIKNNLNVIIAYIPECGSTAILEKFH